MRYLEDIKNKEGRPLHEGQEIWIVGLGPSLDDYPDNFFEGKIAIGLNTTFIAFPHLTYFLTGDAGGLPRLMIETDPELAKRTIWVLSMNLSSKYKNHPNGPTPGTGWGKYKDDLIYATMKLRTLGQVAVFKKALPSVVKDAVQRKIPCHFITLKTCAHTAVLCAVYLGAKKITMVGCEARTTKHSFHAQNRGLHAADARLEASLEKDGTDKKIYSIDEQTGRAGYLMGWQRGAKLVAEALAPYGIELRKYYYKSGYEALV